MSDPGVNFTQPVLGSNDLITKVRVPIRRQLDYLTKVFGVYVEIYAPRTDPTAEQNPYGEEDTAAKFETTPMFSGKVLITGLFPSRSRSLLALDPFYESEVKIWIYGSYNFVNGSIVNIHLGEASDVIRMKVDHPAQMVGGSNPLLRKFFLAPAG